MMQLVNISKSFGRVQALSGVSLTLEGTGIYGLLGNNGAGKTTLLNILTSRIFPDGGSLTLDGQPMLDRDEALSQIFMMGELNLYPEDMRVRRALEITGYMYPRFRMEEALALGERFGLNLKSRITALSTGYRSIFRIVTALSVHTPYLLLDEPVLGLDARHRDLFYKLLLESYGNDPRCILLSTHLIQEAEPLIEEAVILQAGRILRQGSVEKLLSGAYQLSGPAGLVDNFLGSRKPLAQTSLGGLKTVYLEGARPQSCPAGLEISPAGLQGYFIALMEEEESKC